MIKCNTCGQVSQEALVINEVHYECDEWPIEAIPVCPVCHDTDIQKYEGNDLYD